VRGFRIELGEIEAALESQPGVQHALVLAREDTPGDKRLVAYVVPAHGELEVAGLRQQLQERLPDYMLPSAYLLLDAFPLTPNGKIDRNALPAPERSREGVDAAYAAPRSETERLLVAIWQEVLGLDEVGIHDNFFALGGHSLLATQIVTRVKATFGVQFPLNVLFQAPTVERLATYIETVAAVSSGVAAEAASSTDREDFVL
jgi:acyl carrier protein